MASFAQECKLTLQQQRSYDLISERAEVNQAQLLNRQDILPMINDFLKYENYRTVLKFAILPCR